MFFSKADIWEAIACLISVHKKTTQDTYMSALRLWCSFLQVAAQTPESSERLASASIKDCLNFIAWFKRKPGRYRAGVRHNNTNPNTVAHKIVILRTIYDFLVEQGFCQSNPWSYPLIRRHSHTIKPQHAAPMIPFDKVKRFMGTPARCKTGNAVRDTAILALFVGGALRISEVRALKVGDFSITTQGTIFIRLANTKSGESYDHALPQLCIDPVFKLVEQRLDQGATNEDPLIVRVCEKTGTKEYKQVSASYIQKLFKRYALLAGLPAGTTTHSGRATAITKLLSDNVPHREVQHFSRHARISTVEVYDRRKFDVESGVEKKLEY